MSCISKKEDVKPFYYIIEQLSFKPTSEVVKVWYANSQKAAIKLSEELGLENYSIRRVEGERICKSPAIDNISKYCGIKK